MSDLNGKKAGKFITRVKMIPLAAVLMMLIALVWFITGWSSGYIYYYPPVLFLTGSVLLVRDLLSQTFAIH